MFRFMLLICQIIGEKGTAAPQNRQLVAGEARSWAPAPAQMTPL
jgi:hypothetical protein